MSDKERTSPGAASQTQIETTDIWSDGVETASDRRIREYTLKELEKSKKSLPKERYDALVSAVGDILRNHYAKEDEVHEIVRTKIAEFKNEMDAKREPGCLRNKFDPDSINGWDTARYLTEATSTPEKFEAFKKLLASDPDLMAGFVRYWKLLDMRGEVSNYSNVKRIMTQNKGAEGVAKLEDFHKETVDSLGIILNEETLMTRRHAVGEQKTEAIAEQMKAKYNFYLKEDKKYHEREGNKVSKDFSAIVGGASLSRFRNEEIADVFSYAYVHSNPKYKLAKESERIPDAISKIKARFAHDPAGLITISEWWGGKLAKTSPAIDTRLQVGDAESIRKEFITTAKEAFKEATANIVDDFVRKQLGEGADAEKIAKVSKRIREAIEDTKAKPQTNYFEEVGAKIQYILEKAWVKPPSVKDNLSFVRRFLEVHVAERQFEAKNDPKEAKYFKAYQNCKNGKEVAETRAKLLKEFPSENEAIERFASLKMKEFATNAFGERLHFGGYPLSETGSQAAMRMDDEVTPESAPKKIGRIMTSDKKLAEAEKLASAADPKGKPIEKMTDSELRTMAASLDSKAGKTEDDKRLARAVASYLESRDPARREYVAITMGTTYEEIAKREAKGESLESMFEKARKEPVFKNAENRNGGNGKEQASGTKEDGAPWGAASPRSLKEGQSYAFTFAGDSTPVEVKKTSDSVNPYVVSVGGKEAFACSDENLRAHLDMAKLLCDNGLEFLAPVSKEMLKTASVREGNLASAEDGSFSDREKRLLLKSFAKTFGIDGFPEDSTEISGMESYLKTFAADRATTFRDLGMRSRILDENGNVRNRDAFLSRLDK